MTSPYRTQEEQGHQRRWWHDGEFIRRRGRYQGGEVSTYLIASQIAAFEFTYREEAQKIYVRCGMGEYKFTDESHETFEEFLEAYHQAREHERTQRKTEENGR